MYLFCMAQFWNSWKKYICHRISMLFKKNIGKNITSRKRIGKKVCLDYGIIWSIFKSSVLLLTHVLCVYNNLPLQYFRYIKKTHFVQNSQLTRNHLEYLSLSLRVKPSLRLIWLGNHFYYLSPRKSPPHPLLHHYSRQDLYIQLFQCMDNKNRSYK